MAGSGTAHAVTFVVNSPSDVVASAPLDNGVCETAPGNGVCTLRAAVMKANHLPGGGATISIPAGVFTLTIPPNGFGGDERVGRLRITASTTLTGAGSGLTTIEANGTATLDGAMAVESPAGATVAVTVVGVTIRGGHTRTFGAGISNVGDLTLVRTVVTDNHVDSVDANGTVLGCGGCGGGGVANFAALTLIESSIAGNSVTLRASLQTCGTCGGGGIANFGTVRSFNSTISANTLTIANVAGCTDCGGGGILNSGGTATATNSTISGNRALTSGGGVLNVASATTTLINTTVTANKANTSGAGGVGGGVANDSGALTMQNSIVAANELGFVFDDCAGSVVAIGRNLVRTVDGAACAISGAPPLVSLSPALGPLQDNGGATPTHAPLPGSPAIDAGDPSGCRDSLGGALTVDQRLAPRGANGDPCDLGAVEVQPAVALFAAALPSSRSVQVGATATAFGTILNTGSTAATGCRISPVTIVSATFHYQTTNASNQLTGTLDTPVDIPANGAQSFIFSFTPSQPFSPTDVELRFDCTDSNPAPVTIGLNSLLLSASATPVPDIVALAATPTQDGVVALPGVGGASAFAVATVNVGASGGITASVDTGGASLPIAVSICQTNPGTGTCLSGAAATVTTTVAAGATPTFAIFVSAVGSVPFDPASSRIFVRFKDGLSITRGSTSVAVRTQ